MRQNKVILAAWHKYPSQSIPVYDIYICRSLAHQDPPKSSGIESDRKSQWVYRTTIREAVSGGCSSREFCSHSLRVWCTRTRFTILTCSSKRFGNEIIHPITCHKLANDLIWIPWNCQTVKPEGEKSLPVDRYRGYGVHRAWSVHK